MLYKNNKFHKQIVNLSDYELVRWEKYPDKFKYIAYSASGKQIDILLRWKNGNGIAFPAFQISWYYYDIYDNSSLYIGNI